MSKIIHLLSLGSTWPSSTGTVWPGASVLGLITAHWPSHEKLLPLENPTFPKAWVQIWSPWRVDVGTVGLGLSNMVYSRDCKQALSHGTKQTAYSGSWEGFWSCFQPQMEKCWEQWTMFWDREKHILNLPSLAEVSVAIYIVMLLILEVCPSSWIQLRACNDRVRYNLLYL